MKTIDPPKTLGSPKRSVDRSVGAQAAAEPKPLSLILSFDVEEHDRIEAASRLTISPELRAHYRQRLGPPTYWILDELARLGARATFFIVGQTARDHPEVARAIHQAGHEVASHGWDHRRVHVHETPASFRQDVRQSKDALEQAIGEEVLGYRAPTFSIVTRTAWALDVLGELGMLYDSSIHPVRHDRYGIPHAPRSPFVAQGAEHSILELPPLTLRLARTNAPVGGGGYFRLFPLALVEAALEQMRKGIRPAVAMLYFHPWEFDPEAQRLPLPPLSRFRTYVGLERNRERLGKLVSRLSDNCVFRTAIDVARQLDEDRGALPTFKVI